LDDGPVESSSSYRDVYPYSLGAVGGSELDQETTEQISGARSGIIYLLWASGLRFGVYCYRNHDDALDKTALQIVYFLMEISSYINSVIISNYV